MLALTLLIIAILLGDFFTGLFHWWEDQYCTKGLGGFLGTQICDPNLEHHEDQTKFIRETNLWRLNYTTWGLALIPLIIVIYLSVLYPWWTPELNTLALAILIAAQGNQIHAWCHKKPTSKIVKLLQDMCLLQTPHQHARHHRPPFDRCYCTVTNWLNPPLDALGFWRRLENIIRCISFGRIRSNRMVN